MATVQEAMKDDEMPQGVRKSLRAILEMDSKGIEPTGRAVLRYLLEAEGEATSMNMAAIALQLWRRDRLQAERPEIDRIGHWLSTCTDDALRFVLRMTRDEYRNRSMRKADDETGTRSKRLKQPTRKGRRGRR